MRSKSLNYMPALDGLRGLAVLLVCAQHAFPWYGLPGGLGVDVFFVISGFLITRILLREYRATGRIRLGRFYMKRFLRLYPALLAMVLVFVALWWTLGKSLGDVLNWSFWALSYLSNIAIITDTSTVWHIAHTWSLAMEEQFYLVWPVVLIALLWLKLPTRAIVVLLIVGAALSIYGLFSAPESLYFYNPLFRASGILIGCAAALLVEKKAWHSTWVAVVSAIVLAGLFVANQVHTVPYSALVIATVALIPFVLLHAAFGQSVLTRLLSAKWLVHVGVISYGLYLWHFPILKALMVMTDLPGGPRGVLGLVLTLIAALISYRFIERPFNRIKDRVGTKKAGAALSPLPATLQASQTI